LATFAEAVKEDENWVEWENCKNCSRRCGKNFH
jgi:hypothetical protein